MFSFLILSNFDFYLINALVCVDIDQGIHKVKLKIAWNEKQKKTTWVFFIYKYDKFWRVLPEQNFISNLFFLKSVFISYYNTYMYYLTMYINLERKNEVLAFYPSSSLLNSRSQKLQRMPIIKYCASRSAAALLANLKCLTN